MSDAFLYFGDTLKALDDNGRVGGYSVRFTDATRRDLTGEFFTSKTYLGAHEGDGVDVLFHHGMPLPMPEKASASLRNTFLKFSEKIYGATKSKKDDIGLFTEAVLNLADEYEAAVFGLVKAGKLGWSSASAGHTVRKTSNGEITRWPIIEISLTPTPAEPLNRATDLGALRSMKFVKGIFQEAMEVQTPSHWEMESTYCSVVRKIAAAASVAQASGTEFDLEATLSEATSEYTSMLQQSVLGQIKEWLSAGAVEEFYLKTIGGIEEQVSSLRDLDMETHFRLTVSAIRGITSRFDQYRETRQKAGRELSEKNRKRIKDLMGQLMSVHDDLMSLMESSMPSSDDAEKRAKQTQQFMAKYRYGRR